MKQELNKKVEYSQNMLQEVYNNIGEKFSFLFSEVEASLSRASNMVKEFRKQIESSNHTGSLKVVIEGINIRISKIVTSLDQVSSTTHKLLTELKDNLKEFGQIEKSISDIHEYSTLMELMAMNAMVIAIKAGKNGGGFTYITDVLQKNASQTIKLSDELLVLGSLIQKEFEVVSLSATKLGDQESINLSSSIEIKEKFTHSHDSIKIFMDDLDELIKKASTSRTYMLNVSQEIQHQDIIRQSIDHISFLLNEYPITNPIDDEERLDIISFDEYLINFSLPVIDDLNKKIRSNLDIFLENSSNTYNSLSKSEIDRVELIDHHLAKKNDRSGLMSTLNNAEIELDNLSAKVVFFGKEIDNLRGSNIRMTEGLYSLQDKSKRFQNMIRVFRNVILMGKIEVTKHLALEGVDFSVNDIADITNKIENAVTIIDSSIEVMLEKNSFVEAEFELLAQKVEESHNSFYINQSKLSDSVSELEEVLEHAKNSYKLAPDSMKNTIDNCNESYMELEQLNEFLKEFSTYLSREGSRIDKEKKEVLEKNGLENWSVRNQNIVRVLKKFTIFEHKKTAEELAGNEIEHNESVSEGSVTLF